MRAPRSSASARTSAGMRELVYDERRGVKGWVISARAKARETRRETTTRMSSRSSSVAALSYEARSPSRAGGSGFNISSCSRESARVLVPRAAVRARPLQHLETAAKRRVCARQLVPRAAVRARPLQHLETAAPRRSLARLLVPRAAVRARPLHHLELAFLRRVCARPFVPREVLRSQRHHFLEVSACRCRTQVTVEPFGEPFIAES